MSEQLSLKPASCFGHDCAHSSAMRNSIGRTRSSARGPEGGAHWRFQNVAHSGRFWALLMLDRVTPACDSSAEAAAAAAEVAAAPPLLPKLPKLLKLRLCLLPRFHHRRGPSPPMRGDEAASPAHVSVSYRSSLRAALARCAAYPEIWLS